MPFGLPGAREHLWFILTNPDPAGNVLGVNLTSFELFKDTTVVLTEGHPFIVKKSVIQYSDAKLFSVVNLEWMENNSYAQRRETCSAELLKAVRDGLMKSDFTPQEMQTYLQQHP